MRKATTNPIRNRFTQGISIPAFREEGDGGEQDIPIVVRISIPAFREEGDGHRVIIHDRVFPFQSPPSVRKATLTLYAGKPFCGISIPAFREEGDSSVSINAPVLMDFNPRLP